MKHKLVGIFVIMLLIVSFTNTIAFPGEKQQYMYDVGVDRINSPIDDGPAQEFPVQVAIANYGSEKAEMFKTTVKIGEIDIWNPIELFNYNFPSCSPWPPSGWTRIPNNPNWECSYSTYAGGSSPEARFYYSPISTNEFRLYTPPISTTGYNAVEIEFKHSVDHNTAPYTLKVETSADQINWESVWELEPTNDVGPETIAVITGDNVGSDTFYVSWTFKGDSGNIGAWYVDEIVIDGYLSTAPEYTDENCTVEILPGEEKDLNFEKWTPDFLQYGITGTKIYLVKACTDLGDPPDENPSNDCETEILTLDFWHDIGINSITSPGTCISAGVHTIEAIVENLGTFPEIDLTATAEIFKAGGLVHGPVYVPNIALDVPLGGTKLLDFGTYDFSISGEGIYELTICIPLAVDDFPANNCLTQTIFFDMTSPSTIHSIIPNTPTGNHDWYKGPPSTPVSVALTATDSVSGVAKIHYTLDGSTWITHTGSGPLMIPVSGCVKPGNFRYKSEDVCGNVETEKGDSLFKVDTDPPIKHFFNLFFVKVLITKDSCSGLDKIEWTRNGNPWPTTPEYISPSGTNQWRLKIRFGLGSATATVYDMAGNWA